MRNTRSRVASTDAKLPLATSQKTIALVTDTYAGNTLLKKWETIQNSTKQSRTRKG